MCNEANDVKVKMGWGGGWWEFVSLPTAVTDVCVCVWIRSIFIGRVAEAGSGRRVRAGSTFSPG